MERTLTKDSIYNNNVGHVSNGSEDITTESGESCRCPHSLLTSPLNKTPVNVSINLTLPETGVPKLHFMADSMRLSFFKSSW